MGQKEGGAGRRVGQKGGEGGWDRKIGQEGGAGRWGDQAPPNVTQVVHLHPPTANCIDLANPLWPTLTSLLCALWRNPALQPPTVSPS